MKPIFSVSQLRAPDKPIRLTWAERRSLLVRYSPICVILGFLVFERIALARLLGGFPFSWGMAILSFLLPLILMALSVELRILLDNLFHTKRCVSLALFARFVVLNGRIRIRWKDLRQIYCALSESPPRRNLTFEYLRGRVIGFKTLEFVADEAVAEAVGKLQYPGDFEGASYKIIRGAAPVVSTRWNWQAVTCYFLAFFFFIHSFFGAVLFAASFKRPEAPAIKKPIPPSLQDTNYAPKLPEPARRYIQTHYRSVEEYRHGVRVIGLVIMGFFLSLAAISFFGFRYFETRAKPWIVSGGLERAISK
jgi:hypothetical protein